MSNKKRDELAENHLKQITCCSDTKSCNINHAHMFNATQTRNAFKFGYDARDAELNKLVEALSDLAGGCANTGFYGQLGISPGGCLESKHACSHCKGRKVLEEFRGGA